MKALGGVNSNFVNTNGVHDENHYTCAYDMALIGAAIYKLDEFRNIESNITHDIPATNMSDARIGITQHDKMLLPQNEHYCEYIKAGKTGFTDAAKSTLVSMADNGELQLVCVDLSNGKAQIYADTQAMCDYGFANFKKLPIQENEKSEKIESYNDSEACVVVPNNVEFSELESNIELEDKQGKSHEAVLSYTYMGQFVGKTQVHVNKACYEELSGNKEDISMSKVKNQSTHPSFKVWKVVIVIVVIVLLILIIVFILALRARKKRIARQRRRRAMQERRRQRGHFD